MLPLARKFVGSVLGPALLLALACSLPVRGDEEPVKANFQLIAESPARVSLEERSSRTIGLRKWIKSVDGFDPAVVKVTPTSEPNQIRLTAGGSGVTTLILTDETGAVFNIEVLVSGDTKHLEALIRRAFPDSSVQAIKVKDSVLLLGWVNQPDQLNTIVELAEQFHPKVLNYMRVSGIQQVMLRVKMMEVQRGKIRNLGFNFVNLRDANYVTNQVGALAPFTQSATGNLPLTVPYGGPPTVSIAPNAATAAFGLVANDNIFQGFIEALKEESLLKILAEPELLTVNGRPASFLSGGEFPILVPGSFGTVTIQFKPFGVKLDFVPTVLGNGRLRLEVIPEVSEKDLSNQVTVSGLTVPGLTVRRANTQVEMNFGQTLVIAGLISNRVQSRTQKVPFLGELPFLGAAFRRVNHNESETELLIMVTPEFVAPVDDAALPNLGPGQNTVSPTDSELYWHGVMEVQRQGPDPELQAPDFGRPGMIGPSGYIPAGASPHVGTAAPGFGLPPGAVSGPDKNGSAPPRLIPATPPSGGTNVPAPPGPTPSGPATGSAADDDAGTEAPPGKTDMTRSRMSPSQQWGPLNNVRQTSGSSTRPPTKSASRPATGTSATKPAPAARPSTSSRLDNTSRNTTRPALITP